MKRSEAIRHIINVLRLTGNHYCDNGRDKTDANRILERLEIIGMLPPEYVVDCSPMMTTNAWEPEDSTINTEKAINEMLEKLDNDKETKDVLTKLVPDGVKLK